MSMTHQPPLFVESVYDALKAAVAALGGAKAVGIKLWPEKSVDDARRLLLDCLNPDRNERLNPEQLVLLLRLARDAEFHSAIAYIAVECGYQAPAPIDPKDEEARAVSAITEATQTMQRALATLDRLQHKHVRAAA